MGADGVEPVTPEGGNAEWISGGPAFTPDGSGSEPGRRGRRPSKGWKADAVEGVLPRGGDAEWGLEGPLPRGLAGFSTKVRAFSEIASVPPFEVCWVPEKG